MTLAQNLDSAGTKEVPWLSLAGWSILSYLAAFEAKARAYRKLPDAAGLE